MDFARLANESKISPTERNQIYGVFADAIKKGMDFATNEGKNKPASFVMDMLGVPSIATTLDRLSYGEPLTTGKGFATKIKPETAEAVLSVLPFAGAATKPVAKLGGLLGDLEFQGSKAAPALSKASPMADKGAIVWHGTPHKFEPTPNNPLGEFDFSKIGTGEGAQSYGHGGYLGGVKETGEIYRTQLSGRDIRPDELPNLLKTYQGMANATKSPAVKEAYLKSIDELKASGGKQGYLYKVDLPDEHIAKMLDWDKPLSEQSHISFSPNEANSLIKNYQKKTGGKTNYGNFYEQKGNELNALLSDALGGEKAAAEYLKSKGATGIKYLDQGSRGAGAGSHNYVVFPGNEKLLTILERNGQTANDLAGVFKYPQSEALKLAQERAALPTEQGGLGLPANNTAMDRANAMGFDTPVYHGGYSDIKKPSYDFSGKGNDQYGSSVLYTATNPTLSSGYAEKALEGANVMPLRINTQAFVDEAKMPILTNAQVTKMIKNSPEKDAIYNFGDVDYEGLGNVIKNAANQYKAGKGEGLNQLNTLSNDFYPVNPEMFNNEVSKLTGVKGISADAGGGKFYMPWNADDIRSQFAAFDPWRKTAATAAAFGVAAPDLLAKENPGVFRKAQP